MNEFVEQCRAEWRRLGVPDAVADEMAADLASDLNEAKAEGISADELLGASASDPKAFAASWAAERGIIPVQPTAARRLPIMLVMFTALAAMVLVFTGLLLLTGQPKVSLVKSHPNLHGVASSTTPHKAARLVVNSASASTPVEWILLFGAVASLAFAGWLWSNWRRSGPLLASTS